MSGETYVTRYEEFCNQSCNYIFQLRQKYERLRANLTIDYKNGKMTEELYKRLMAVKINEYEASYYTLSFDEVSFIKEYANVSRSGELMMSLLRPDLLEKKDIIKDIYSSVRIFSYFDGMSIEEMKECFKADVKKEAEAKFLKDKRRINKRNMDEELAKAYSTIDSVDEEGLRSLLEQFYDINYKYFEWFKLMTLKEEFDTGFVFVEHVNVSQEIITRISNINNLTQEKDKINELLDITLSTLLSFYKNVINYQYDKEGIIGRFKKGRHYESFSKALEVAGVLRYLKSFLGLDDELIQLDELYNKYIEKMYDGDVSNISLDSFIRRIFNNTYEYYMSRIEESKRQLEENKAKVNEEKKILNILVNRGLDEATLEKDIVFSLDKLNNLGLEGISKQELDIIFSELKIIVTKDKDKEQNTELVKNKRF